MVSNGKNKGHEIVRVEWLYEVHWSSKLRDPWCDSNGAMAMFIDL